MSRAKQRNQLTLLWTDNTCMFSGLGCPRVVFTWTMSEPRKQGEDSWSAAPKWGWCSEPLGVSMEDQEIDDILGKPGASRSSHICLFNLQVLSRRWAASQCFCFLRFFRAGHLHFVVLFAIPDPVEISLIGCHELPTGHEGITLSSEWHHSSQSNFSAMMRAGHELPPNFIASSQIKLGF